MISRFISALCIMDRSLVIGPQVTDGEDEWAD